MGISMNGMFPFFPMVDCADGNCTGFSNVCLTQVFCKCSIDGLCQPAGESNRIAVRAFMNTGQGLHPGHFSTAPGVKVMDIHFDWMPHKSKIVDTNLFLRQSRLPIEKSSTNLTFVFRTRQVFLFWTECLFFDMDTKYKLS